jgi:hypothetical protein
MVAGFPLPQQLEHANILDSAAARRRNPTAQKQTRSMAPMNQMRTLRAHLQAIRFSQVKAVGEVLRQQIAHGVE